MMPAPARRLFEIEVHFPTSVNLTLKNKKPLGLLRQRAEERIV